MTRKLQITKNVILKVFLLVAITAISTMTYAQTPPPEGNSSQYFCSATSWMSAGFTEPGDTFEELYIYGENLKFYENLSDIPANPIANPSSYVLVDGETYYVTQTIGGNESAPLTIDVTDRECGCFKNHDFETLDNQGDTSSFTFYQETYQQGHKTCSGSIAAAAPLTVGATNNNNGETVLVTPGVDGEVVYSSLAKTNPSNPTSDFALRLNDPGGTSTVNHLEKEFVAGEIFMFNFAAVFQNPNPLAGACGHAYNEQPYLYIQIQDQNNEVIATRCIVSDDTDCVFKDAAFDVFNCSYKLYTEWSCMKINTLDIIGQKAKVIMTMGDCTRSGHFGYIYIDDFFVGDDVDSNCTDPSFGYIAMDDIVAAPSASPCVESVGSQTQDCGGDINASVPFPIDICGTIKLPASSGQTPDVQDLTLQILKNGQSAGTLSNPSINGDQFCFTINQSDITVADAFGQFEFSSTVNYYLDCGDPYDIVISDKATIDVCPTVTCSQPLTTCDGTGTGIGVFDLTQAGDTFRGTDWTAADVDITFYESFIDAADENIAAAIPTPSAYQNTTPYNQTIYARLDWHPVGTPTDCFYVVNLDLTVYEDPIVNMPAQTVACGPGALSVPIVATPSNITNLTNVTYTWYKEDSNGNNVLIPFTGSYYTATQGGIYTVTVSEANCSVTHSTEVVYADYTVDLGNPLIDLCGTGNSATLTATVTDQASNPAMDMSQVTYLWSTNETTPTITVTQSGIYTVTTDYFGCVQTDMVDVQISERPVIDLGVDQTICDTPNDPTDDAVITADIANFQPSEVDIAWYLDGNLLAGQTSETITVNTPGVYTVEINEIGAPDCIGTDEVTVEFYANGGCVLPQGISPETTPGLNDCLDLAFLNDRSGIQNIKIYNRYGRLVFEADNYVDTFCGFDKDGEPLPTGTYFYVMVLENEDPVFGKTKKSYIYINREAN